MQDLSLEEMIRTSTSQEENEIFYDLTFLDKEVNNWKRVYEECDIAEAINKIIEKRKLNFDSSFQSMALIPLLSDDMQKRLFAAFSLSSFNNSIITMDSYLDHKDPPDYSTYQLSVTKGFQYNELVNNQCLIHHIYIPPTNISIRLLVLYFYLQRGYFKTILHFHNELTVTIELYSDKLEFSDGLSIECLSNPILNILADIPPGYMKDCIVPLVSVWYIGLSKWKCLGGGRYPPLHSILDFSTLPDISNYELRYLEIGRLNTISIDNFPFTFRPILVNSETVKLWIIRNEILENLSVFTEDNQLDWTKLSIVGINHFYSYIHILFDSSLYHPQMSEDIAEILKVENTHEAILAKLDSIDYFL